MSKSIGVQKIASKAEEISRFVYKEGFLILDRVKEEETSEILEDLERILKRIKKISIRNIE